MHVSDGYMAEISRRPGHNRPVADQTLQISRQLGPSMHVVTRYEPHTRDKWIACHAGRRLQSSIQASYTHQPMEAKLHDIIATLNWLHTRITPPRRAPVLIKRPVTQPP